MGSEAVGRGVVVENHPRDAVSPGVASTSGLPPLLTDRSPHPLGRATSALVGSAARTAAMLQRRAIVQPRRRVGDLLDFADGSTGTVYRETTVRDPGVDEPSTLLVRFRLRYVRGRGHAWFRAESLLNTPLFVGFPGFVSKLWLAHDANGVYRGVYEWDGPRRAESYVRSLWWVLALVSERASIGYIVIPGLRRDEMLSDPQVLERRAPNGGSEWWRLVRYDRSADDPSA